MKNVADDGDGNAGEGFAGYIRYARPQMREDGAQIQQRLGGMLVHAVAGVENWKARFGFEKPGGAPEALCRKMIASAPSAEASGPCL